MWGDLLIAVFTYFVLWAVCCILIIWAWRLDRFIFDKLYINTAIWFIILLVDVSEIIWGK